MSPSNIPVIFGATSTLGQALTKACKKLNIKKVLLSRSGKNHIKFDAQNISTCCFINDISSLHTVYLAFGESNLDYVGDNPLATKKVNIDATMFLAAWAIKKGARVVFFSSEQVIAGRDGENSEISNPLPINEYGRQKAFVENQLSRLSGNWVIARMGSVISCDRGNNCMVEKTYNSLIAKNALMARNNIFSLTPVDQVAHGLIEAMQGTFDRQIVNLVCNKAIARQDLAQKICETSKKGRLMNFELCDFSNLSFKEPRAKSSFLISNNHWVLDNFNAGEQSKVIEAKIEVLDA
jgi:dTDP-4-dehydrorhamnose reductase